MFVRMCPTFRSLPVSISTIGARSPTGTRQLAHSRDLLSCGEKRLTTLPPHPAQRIRKQ